MDQYTWTEDLIKGKITENIFEQLFQNCQDCVVFHYGYEYTTPELVKIFHGERKLREDLRETRKAPDYIMIKNGERGALVEVKYRNELNLIEVLEMARVASGQWDKVYLFIATKNGFYFDSCEGIVLNNGSIPKLSENVVSQSIQDRYLEILNRFIG